MEYEKWRSILDYPNYSVSSNGKIKNNSTNKILSLQINKNGYISVNIKPNGRFGKSKTLRVHREVALAFIPNPENFPVVNHKDGNKTNNNMDNLEWTTASYNNKHAIALGLVVMPVGEDNSHAKLSEADVEFIRKVYIPGDKFFGARALSRRFHTSKSTITRVIHRECWTHIN